MFFFLQGAHCKNVIEGRCVGPIKTLFSTFFFLGLVLQKLRVILGECGVGVGRQMGVVLGECQDVVGSCLEWEKCGSREGFSKLGISNFKNM